MSYGQNYADDCRGVATYVEKIFKGARPGDLPIEQLTKFEMIIRRNPSYDFNDQALPYGASFFARVIEKRMAR